MNLSDTSSIVTIFLGCITGITWLWKLKGWFVKSYVKAKENSELGRRLSAQLIANTTTAEKRADIHLYLLTLSIESNARKVQASTRANGLGLIILIYGLFISTASRFISSITDPLVMFAIIAFVALLLSFFMAIWFSYIHSKLDDGWNEGFKSAIEGKIDKHLTPNA